MPMDIDFISAKEYAEAHGSPSENPNACQMK